jgi:hypothetical protein
MISDERLKNIVACVTLMGKDKAKTNFNLKDETLNRHLRLARQKGFLNEGHELMDKRPNILVLDIENAPTLAGVWGVWQTNVPLDLIFSYWFMLSWSAKWLYDDEVFSDVLTAEEAKNEDDKRIVQSLWEMIDSADILIGHNIIKFDTRKMNTRFLFHGMKPPSPVQQIDTLMIARKNFSLESNKLDFLAKFLGIPGKLENGGAETWKKCVKGDADSLLLMDKYNRQDIMTTEDVYVKLRPWMRSHPNLALYHDDMVTRCPTCESIDLQYDTNKSYVTPMNTYTAIRCNNCGAVGRARTSSLGKDRRQYLMTTTAR